MNAVRLFAIVLLVAGALGLIYGGFSYTKDTTAVKVGSLELSVKEQKQVNIPLWAGIGAIVAGGVLLLAGSKRG
jgi:TRAP-type C4-dicarboxylate transport system permease small subunit